MLFFSSPFLHFGHTKLRAGGWVCAGSSGAHRGMKDRLLIGDRGPGPVPTSVPTLRGQFLLLIHVSQPLPCNAKPKPGWTLAKGCKTNPRKGLEPGATSLGLGMPEPALGRVQP